MELKSVDWHSAKYGSQMFVPAFQVVNPTNDEGKQQYEHSLQTRIQ